MRAVSSFKPSEKREQDFVRAKNSWLPIFDKIIYIREADDIAPAPNGINVYVHSESRPSIKEMAKIAADQSGWSCLINADIIVNPRLKLAEHALNKLGADCAFSRRIPVDAFEPVDLGLDFFCAKPDIWKAVSVAIPSEFLIGKQQWDTWLMSFLAHEFRETFYDLSPSKLIYHPNHEDRGDQSIQIEPDKYLKNVRWAAKQLKV